MKPLESRIAAALSGNVPSTDLAKLIAEVTAAIDDADATAKAERQRALDPQLSPDPKSARTKMEDAEFAAARLRTVQPRLELHYQEIAAVERSANWQKDFAVLKTERDTLANEGKEFLPDVFARTASYFHRCAALDAKIAELHSRRPAGLSLHLSSVEAVARNVQGFSRDVPSIAAELKLPAFEPGAPPLWPPPAAPITSYMITPPATLDTTADWWRVAEQRARDAQAERARWGAHYEREQQAREAAER